MNTYIKKNNMLHDIYDKNMDNRLQKNSQNAIEDIKFFLNRQNSNKEKEISNENYNSNPIRTHKYLHSNEKKTDGRYYSNNPSLDCNIKDNFFEPFGFVSGYESLIPNPNNNLKIAEINFQILRKNRQKANPTQRISE